MDRPSDRPLTVAEAKNRLRRSTEAVLPSLYIRRHPYTVLLFAIGAGYLLGKALSVQGLVTRTLLRAL